ncbi:hypothetical protein ES703_111825 [subsurface metagenome]
MLSRAERTSVAESGSVAVAVSGNMAEGVGDASLTPSPISASSQTTNKGGGDGHDYEHYILARHKQYAPLYGVGNGGGEGRPSVLTNVSSSNSDTKTAKNGWSRQQKRGYHRIQSCLQYWQANGFQVLWVMLSTADGGNASKLAYHHQRLRQRIEAGLGYKGIQHYQVRTSEGNGVLHILWAWKAMNGFRQRSFYVEQAWLGKQWQGIHSAPIVWIARVKGGRVSRNKVSRYCMSQYVGSQSGYEYMSWSWGRTFGFPLVACWRAFKGVWSKHNGNGHRRALYAFWGAFLSGQAMPLWVGRYTSLELVRLGYQEYHSALWASPQ